MFRRSRHPSSGRAEGEESPALPDARLGGQRPLPASEYLPGEPAVTLRDVHKRYGRGNSAVHALRGVGIALPRASFTAVMGPSGSGKSTFLQCAAGLDRPTSGSVLLGDTDLTKLRESRLSDLRLNRLGFVFQHFNLLPALTVYQNIRLPLKLAGRPVDRGAIEQMLARVGLPDRARHRPGELSGGQQQRVAIARALITDPDVIFADEPTGALDTTTAAEVLTLLREAVDNLGATVVMVTHEPSAAAWADRVLFLVDGEVSDELMLGDPEEISARMRVLTSATDRPQSAAPGMRGRG
ncbi:ABC transporter ATP-binding protein [Streptomyces sp. MCA2]|uniref:ABC transporter ATP-binding protein n=1 Tax=Streptomyces sp. MCA2 TaxID=2944805 RepID=UPI002021E3B2|nr:ABC transporter ATP-binding protein [Streptomyces sp. MCA2]MCL7496372.1 ABC transporter ATP-binding protein [Streptomyces sp. MCA2]